MRASGGLRAASSSSQATRVRRVPGSFSKRSHRLAPRRDVPATLTQRRAPCCSAAGTEDAAERHDAEREHTSPLGNDELTVPTTCMAQLSGSGGATMQKSKLNLREEVRISQPKTDDAGGGGDIGNRIFNGGGGGGDDSDDDEYQDDFGDDEDGDAAVGLFALRDALPELFDRATAEAILSEWYRTVTGLPAGLRMAVEMSVVSSAQLVRFLSLDYRPKLARHLTRALPTEPSRAFVGRLMGDPAFMYKVALEQMLTIMGSVLCELRMRGDNFRKEWREVAATTAVLCAANGATVWLTAPSRAFGSTSRFGWQQSLSKLPNHVFERSSPLRRYTTGDRSMAALLKAGQLALVGLTAGAAGTGLSAAVRRPTGDTIEEASVSSPSGKKGGALSMRGPIIGLAAHMALSTSVRYQGIAGLDRWLSQRCGHLGMVVGGTTVARVANAGVGEVSRLWCQGINVFENVGGKGKGGRRRWFKIPKRAPGKRTGGMAFSTSAAASRARISV